MSRSMSAWNAVIAIGLRFAVVVYALLGRNAQRGSGPMDPSGGCVFDGDLVRVLAGFGRRGGRRGGWFR